MVAIQKQLAALTRWYVWCGLAIGPVWWLLWMPCAMVLAALVGVDVFARAPGYFASWTVYGLAGLLLTWARLPLVARLLAGAGALHGRRRHRRVVCAAPRAVIDEIERFEHEEAEAGGA